jgi:hypothetical protein
MMKRQAIRDKTRCTPLFVSRSAGLHDRVAEDVDRGSIMIIWIRPIDRPRHVQTISTVHSAYRAARILEFSPNPNPNLVMRDGTLEPSAFRS